MFISQVITYNAVAPWDKHSECESPKDRTAHDAKDSKGCLQHTGQVLNQKHHKVGEDSVGHGQDFGDDEFFLLCQLSFDVANDEILHGDGSKRAET